LISPRTGRRWRTERAGWALAALLASATSDAAPVETLLLPGVDIREADLEVGKWCRYLIVDEALGVADSSEVTVAIVGREDVGGEPAYWVEFEAGPYGAAAADRDRTLALVSGGITRHARGDSLYRYVHTLYNQKGEAHPERADPRSLERLTLTRPTTDADWTAGGEAAVSTPAGDLRCQRRDLSVETAKEIPSGRVTVVQRNTDRFTVWSAREVPVFHLVKCVIERTRESRTRPAVRGIPDVGPRESRTTTLLLAFGDGATSHLPLRADP